MSRPYRWVGVLDLSVEQTGMFTPSHYAACYLQSHDVVVRNAARVKAWTQQVHIKGRVRLFSGESLDAYREEVTQRLIAGICSIKQ